MRTEFTKYSKDDIAEILKFTARLKLIGSFYIGSIGEPTVRWCDDGSAEVFIEHSPAKDQG
jgi:hypothetical protein